jgi:predicted translin family RNA/ssDNA-binding protein
MTPAEKKILDLSARVIAQQETDEFQPAVEELRATIHAYLEGIRDKVAELAFVVANESDSKAAD